MQRLGRNKTDNKRTCTIWKEVDCQTESKLYKLANINYINNFTNLNFDGKIINKILTRETINKVKKGMTQEKTQ